MQATPSSACQILSKAFVSVGFLETISKSLPIAPAKVHAPLLKQISG
jgi:hypothetical protein